MTRIWEFLRTIGGVVLLLMIGVWLMGSSQRGHPLNHSEFARALDHFMAGVMHIVGQGSHWLVAKGR